MQQNLCSYGQNVELDPEDVEMVKRFMQQQQEALLSLSNIVADDIEDMKIIANETKQMY